MISLSGPNGRRYYKSANTLIRAIRRLQEKPWGLSGWSTVTIDGEDRRWSIPIHRISKATMTADTLTIDQLIALA